MKDTEDLRDYRFTSLVKNHVTTPKLIESLPSSIDHTNEMSPVKDQDDIGSCVAFSIAAVKEWQEQKEHRQEVEEGKFDHRDDKYYDLSEAWIYKMAKKIDPWPDEEGTSIRHGLKVINKIGVPCEKAWPYDEIVNGKPKKWANLVALWSLIDSYWKISNLTELISALTFGPIIAGIGVFEEIFYVGKDGIIPLPAQPQYCYGGHAICLVGFNAHTKLIKFKNSWSKNWGDNGYGYLPYKYIKRHMWDAWAIKDLSVTKEMLKGARSLI